MSDFKAKMHQIRFPLGSTPDPAAGAIRPLSVFKGPTSKWRDVEERGGEKGKGEGRRVREGE